MAKILLLSRDDALCRQLTSSLRALGFGVERLDPWEKALTSGRSRGSPLILLDLDPELPTPRELRAWTEAPILLLVDPQDLPTLGPSPEADDLVIKPLREAEFLLRVRRLLKERRGEEGSPHLSSGGLVIDEEKYEVTLDDSPVDLTYREYELLRYLMANPGKVFDRDHLLNLVWGLDYIGGPRTVDVHIRRIRAKVEHGGKVFIRTIRGVGYKFIG